ncbi:DUF255 domain-containing protein [Elusimicrobiota bacterium]
MYLIIVCFLSLVNISNAARLNFPTQDESFRILSQSNKHAAWHSWDTSTIRKARLENKPIVLFMGFEGCYWCRVMENDILKNLDIKRILNEHFIAIKIDYKKQADIFAQHRNNIESATGNNTGPFIMFFTPKLEAFFVGSYFQARSTRNNPGFKELLVKVKKLYDLEKERLRPDADNLSRNLNGFSGDLSKPNRMHEAMLDRSAAHITQSWNKNPGKYPNLNSVHFLLRLAATNHKGNRLAVKEVFPILERIAQHPEAHLNNTQQGIYKSAQLARIYAEAWQMTKKALYKDIALKQIRNITDNLSMFQAHTGIAPQELSRAKALAVSALAYAGTSMSSDEYVSMSAHLADKFIKQRKADTNSSSGKSPLEDHAYWMLALKDTYEATLKTRYLGEAKTLAQDTIRLFYDKNSRSFVSTLKNADGNYQRSIARYGYDGSVPSGNSAACHGVLKLLRYFENRPWIDIVEKCFKEHSQTIGKDPVGSSYMLLTLLDYLEEPWKIKLTGKAHDKKRIALKGITEKWWWPAKMVAWSPPPPKNKSGARKSIKTRKYANGAEIADKTFSWEIDVSTEAASKAGIHLCKGPRCVFSTDDPDHLENFLRRELPNLTNR